jgi:hypothetical protein
MDKHNIKLKTNYRQTLVEKHINERKVKNERKKETNKQTK